MKHQQKRPAGAFEEFFGISEGEFGKKIADVIDGKVERSILDMRVKMREMERTIKELQLMMDRMYLERCSERKEGYISTYPECENCRRNAANPVRPRGCDGAKEVTVIQTVSLRGTGTLNDLCHLVEEYWTKDGKKIGEVIVN